MSSFTRVKENHTEIGYSIFSIVMPHIVFSGLFQDQYTVPFCSRIHTVGMFTGGMGVRAFFTYDATFRGKSQKIFTIFCNPPRCQYSKSLQVDPNKSSQSSYAVLNVHKGHGDQEILRAQELIESHFTDSINMKDLARKVGISPRHSHGSLNSDTKINHRTQICSPFSRR